MTHDYCVFMCNWHPLWGLVFAHPYHPYGRRDRIFAMIVGLTEALLGAVIFAQSRGCAGNLKRDYELFRWTALPILVQDALLQRVAVLDAVLAGAQRDVAGDLAGCLAASARCFLSFLFIVSCFVLLLLHVIWEDFSTGRLIPFSHEVDARASLWSRAFPMWLEIVLQWHVGWLPIHFLLPGLGFFWRWKAEKRERDYNRLLRDMRDAEDSLELAAVSWTSSDATAVSASALQGRWIMHRGRQPEEIHVRGTKFLDGMSLVIIDEDATLNYKLADGTKCWLASCTAGLRKEVVWSTDSSKCPTILWQQQEADVNSVRTMRTVSTRSAT